MPTARTLTGLATVIATVIAAVMATVIAAAMAPGPGSAAAESGPVATARDGKWVSISGEVVAKLGDTFQIEHGDGLVTVESDDFLGPEGMSRIEVGHRVTVYGEVDADLYEKHTIEAGRIHNETNDTYHFALPTDEEAIGATVGEMVASDYTLVESGLTVSGEITGIEGREITVDIGGADPVTVDTSDMAHDPTDDVGYPQLRTGDRIQASGDLTGRFFEDRAMSAVTVTLLAEAPADS